MKPEYSEVFLRYRHGMIKSFTRKWPNLAPFHVEEAVDNAGHGLLEGIINGTFEYQGEPQFVSAWKKTIEWRCNDTFKKNSRMQDFQNEYEMDSRDAHVEDAILREQSEDPFFLARLIVKSTLKTSFGMAESDIEKTVKECFEEMAAEYKDALTSAKSVDKKTAISNKLATLANLSASGVDKAKEIDRTEGRVSQISDAQWRRLKATILARCNLYRTCHLEIPCDAAIPRTRPGMKIKEFVVSNATLGMKAELPIGGKATISIYTGDKEIECIESCETEAARFTCRNATLLVELRHPKIIAGQPNGINLVWKRSADELLKYANDGLDAVAKLAFGYKKMKKSLMTSYRLPQGASIEFSGPEGNLTLTVPSDGPAYSPPKQQVILASTRRVEVVNFDGKVKAYQVPQGCDAIFVFDRHGAILASTERENLIVESNSRPSRRDWGWPIHLHAKPNATADGSTIYFEYFGEVGKIRRTEDSINVSFLLEFPSTIGQGGKS